MNGVSLRWFALGFQSTHPRRVRRPAFQVLILAGDVSIHAPTQGATTGALARASTPRLFQSTHPRRVRQHRRMDAEGPRNVSIHAPTQGATIAPPRVAIAAVAFQSTHPRRVRLEGFPLLYAIEGVSIHAPTQGATISRSYSVLNLLFQSTHPRRVRHFLGVVPESLAQFQSTHPRRVRRLLGGRQVRVHRVSIHAPTQGATSSTCGSHRSESSFNPRTHAGCDSAVRPVFRVGDVVSIHAPTQGATLRR